MSFSTSPRPQASAAQVMASPHLQIHAGKWLFQQSLVFAHRRHGKSTDIDDRSRQSPPAFLSSTMCQSDTSTACLAARPKPIDISFPLISALRVSCAR